MIEKSNNFHPAYRKDIDGLRAVAIILVVIFHAFPEVLAAGFIGVDVFFVISGFLISSIIFRSVEKGDFSFSEFYAHRIKRIFPALIVVLLACLVLGWFLLLPSEYAELGRHTAGSSAFTQNFLLRKAAGYFDVAAELKPLLHLWSLSVEEQFYLLYPLLIWGAWRSRFNLFYTVLVLALLSFVANVSGMQKDVVKVFYLPHTRFWELLAGGILAWAYPRLLAVQARWGSALSVAGALLLVVTLSFLRNEKSFPGWWALLPVLSASLLILAGPQAWLNRQVLSWRLMVGVGLISYPLYLWHWPLLSFARIVKDEAPAAGVRMAAVFLSILLAWLTYRLVERPIRFGRFYERKTAILSAALIVTGCLGYATFKSGGWEFRPSVRDIAENDRQFVWKEKKSAECQQRYPAVAKLSFCLVSGEKEPSVLVVGDSHANRLYPGLAAEFEKTSEVVANFGSSGCPPLLDTMNNNSCADDARKLFDLAAKSASAHTVVIGGRGPAYTSGTGFGDVDRLRYVLARPGQPDVKDNAAIYEQALRETFAKMIDQKKRIIFVLDNPELGFDPKSCLRRPLNLSKVRSPCVIPRKEFDERNEAYREIVMRVSNDFPAVTIFDAASVFCDEKWCSAMKDDRLLYQDNHHLSGAGSAYLARSLAAIVREGR